jgi:hypothetical protein
MLTLAALFATATANSALAIELPTTKVVQNGYVSP